MDWMDFNNDGEVDATESFLGEEMLCSSREEHELLFGDAGDFDDDESDDEEDELEVMDEDERREALEDAGLDPDDFEF